MRKLVVCAAALTVLLLGSSGPVTAKQTPRPAHELPRPSARGPWLALGLSFGGLATGVVLIALWGAGRGPEPTLGPAEDPGAH